LRATTQTTIDKKSKFCTQFNHDAEKIDILSTQIEDFKSGDNLQRLETIDTEINSVSQEVHENEDELRQTGPKLKSLQSKVDDQDAYRKNVERNIELLDMISEKQKLVDEISLLEQDLKELDGDSIQQEYSASQKKIRRFESEKDRHEGGKDALQRQQRDLKVSLFSICFYFLFAVYMTPNMNN
jgi:chromosome segregation ATPase